MLKTPLSENGLDKNECRTTRKRRLTAKEIKPQILIILPHVNFNLILHEFKEHVGHKPLKWYRFLIKTDAPKRLGS